MKFASWSLAACLVLSASLAAAQNAPNPMPKPNLPPGGQPGAGQPVPQPQFGQPVIDRTGAANAAAMRGAMLKNFDLNGDGKLSQQEQLAATKAMQQRGIRVPGAPNLAGPGSSNGPISGPGVALPAQQEPAKKPTRREEILLERFDKDGDGKLNDEEKAAARAELGQKDKKK